MRPSSGADRRQLGRAQVNAGIDSQPVREIAGRGRHRRGSLARLRLVAHAQRTAGHLHAGAGLAESAVGALLAQNHRVHLGRRRDPQARAGGRSCRPAPCGGAEVANVGHAGADEYLVDLLAGDMGQKLDVVRIVGAGDDGLLDLAPCRSRRRRRYSASASGCEQRRIGQPGLHGRDAALQSAAVLVAVGRHPLQQGHVRAGVLDHRLLGEAHRAGGGGTFGRGVGQLERLLDLQVGQALDLEDGAGEDVLLALLLDGQQPLLDGHIGNGVDQIAQRDAGLHGALEADQHGFRHVERHHAGGGGEGDEAGAGREGNAEREAGVGIAAGAHRVGQQHAVEPRMDDAVAGTQGDAAALGDEAGRVLWVLTSTGFG